MNQTAYRCLVFKLSDSYSPR